MRPLAESPWRKTIRHERHRAGAPKDTGAALALVEPTEPGVVFAVYDNASQQIDRVYDTRRSAEACCDEWNSAQAWERYVVEQDDADLWDETQVLS